jgi:hypothetical protein
MKNNSTKPTDTFIICPVDSYGQFLPPIKTPSEMQGDYVAFNELWKKMNQNSKGVPYVLMGPVALQEQPQSQARL